MAGQRDPELVAGREQRGYWQQLHGEVEVLAGLDGQLAGPGEAAGHAEPGGIGGPFVARWRKRRQPSVRYVTVPSGAMSSR